MKIKQKRQVNLPQLIEWCWEKNFKDKSFFSVPPQKVVVDVWEQNLSISTGYDNPDSSTRFEIEEEVEITEDTKLELVAETSLDNFGSNYVFARENESVRTIISESVKHGGTILTLHYVHPDGTMTLLWKDGEMVE